MDMFMDKLAQKLTAQEIIKANTAADVEELNKLKKEEKKKEKGKRGHHGDHLPRSPGLHQHQ